jgi:regulator of protease activity HflC (stomatin/prohibitin superfamily)
MNALVALVVVIVVLLVLAVILLPAAVKVLPEYQRGVVFRLGRITGIRGPGLIILIPIIDKMRRIDLRVVTLEVPPQEVITLDNVTIKVTAVVYFRVVNANDAVVKVLDYVRATSQIAQTTLRSILGQSAMDEILAKREQINAELQRIIDEQTEPWGIKVSTVEIKDVELPSSMQRAMARQAEAEREKRAKIIHADGEYQAATQLASAARIIQAEPAALQLRYLQTLTEIATERTSTVVFPLPIDVIEPFMRLMGRSGREPNGSEPDALPPRPDNITTLPDSGGSVN